MMGGVRYSFNMRLSVLCLPHALIVARSVSVEPMVLVEAPVPTAMMSSFRTCVVFLAASS